MDDRGAWRDNVFVERLWRSVNHEWVYRRAYDGFSAASTGTAGYSGLDSTDRPHSSLGDQTPRLQPLRNL